MARRPGAAALPAVDLEQLQAECLELVDDAVQGGLVGEAAGEQRVVSAAGRGQGRECLHDRRAERAADADLIASRTTAAGRGFLGWHALRVGVRRMSAHRTVWINATVRLSITGCNHVGVVADSAAAVEYAGPGVRRWLVPRPGLFERLGAAERVV